MDENCFEKEYTVLTSACDAQGLLGVRSVFDLFMDMAAEHAERLHVSYEEMLAQRCFWVAVRTRVRLYERPPMGQKLTAMTWPARPTLAKCDRFYTLARGADTVAEGRTEWAVQDIDTGRVRRMDSFSYPLDMEHRAERVCGGPFTRFKAAEAGPADFWGKYTVGSMDIDTGRHMNNVAYIRMLLNTFTTAELAAMDMREVEISYRLGCYEGEALSIYRAGDGEGWRFQVQKPDGQIAVQAVIRLGA